MVGKKPRELSDKWFGLLAQIPVFILLGLVVIFPLIYALNLSLFENNLRFPLEHDFIGFGNYYTVVTAPLFRLVVQNTVFFTILAVTAITLFSLGVALVFNEQFKGRGLARTLLLVPWAIPAIVNGLMWKELYSTNFGVINWLLQLGGLSPVGWLTDKNVAMYSVVIAQVWKEFPWATLLLLAGVAAVPEDLFDASKVDGANFIQRFRHVTLPLIRPMIILVLIFETMWSLWAFDVIYAITRGGPSASTTTLGYWLYEVAFRQMEFGEGAALSYIMGVVILVIAYVYIRALYRETG